MSAEAQEKQGINETMEAIAGVNELALALIPILKDGVQVADAVALFDKLKNDTAFKEKLEAAYRDINKVPAEVKDIDFGEGMELVMLQASYVPKIIAALKAEAPKA